MRIILSQIITVSRYKSSEFVQLPDLLTMWVSLGKKTLKEIIGELNIEEWSKRILMR